MRHKEGTANILCVFTLDADIDGVSVRLGAVRFEADPDAIIGGYGRCNGHTSHIAPTALTVVTVTRPDDGAAGG